MFLIFFGAAVLATIALFARQALIIAYILLGAIVGPSGASLVTDAETIQDISDIGIMFLLYLLGLNLSPRKFMQTLAEVTQITLVSSLIFSLPGLLAGYLLGFSWVETLLIGAAMMFSSTILGLKLLPTTTLHHRRAGEIMIGILLLQDIIAIIILSLLAGFRGASSWHNSLMSLLIALPIIVLVAFLAERYLLRKIIARFDTIQEYIFLVTIGWCLGIAQLSASMGFSYETGAFIAGVALANSPISAWIADSLKPLRDFFLVIYFFAIGAAFNWQLAQQLLLPAFLLAACMLLLKPIVFERLLKFEGETDAMSKNLGLRLGQVSEFSLLIAIVGIESGVLQQLSASLIQATSIICLTLSSMLIVLKLPTPIAVSDDLRQD